MKQVCVFLLLPLLLLVSCREEQTFDMEALHGIWRPDAATISPALFDSIAGTYTSDYLAWLDACATDGSIVFAPEDIYQEDEGPTKCASEAPQTVTGTWRLTDSDNPSITIDFEDNTSRTFRQVNVDGVALHFDIEFALLGTRYTVHYQCIKQ